MSIHEKNRVNEYLTAGIEPLPQIQDHVYKFSSENLKDAKITLDDVINFARQEKLAELGHLGDLQKEKLGDARVESSSGIVEFEKDGFTGKIRWWAFYPSLGGDKPPVIAMHGGPSFNHMYMLPLKLLAYPEFGGYPVIFYDQCGCGGSTSIAPSNSQNATDYRKAIEQIENVSGDKTDDLHVIPPHLFTIQYYVEEFLHLLHSWSTSKDYPICFQKGYYLYGSSWGTILAQEVAVHLREAMDRKVDGLISEIGTLPKLMGLFLDGALSDAQVYCKSQWKYRISRMPSFTYHLLKELETMAEKGESGMTNPELANSIKTSKIDWHTTKTYKKIESALSSMFTTRLQPPPDFWEECLAGANMEIYCKMQGASEFTIGGCLKNWSIVNRLPILSRNATFEELNVVKTPLPVLALAGEFDTMTIECHENVLESIGDINNELVVIPRAGHCKTVDEPLACCEAVLDFISKTT